MQLQGSVTKTSTYLLHVVYFKYSPVTNVLLCLMSWPLFASLASTHKQTSLHDIPSSHAAQLQMTS